MFNTKEKKVIFIFMAFFVGIICQSHSRSSQSEKSGHYLLESILFKDGGVSWLKHSSCLDLSFPHCLYVKERIIKYGDRVDYPFILIHRPLECHWQEWLSQDERAGLFSHIQSIQYSVKTGNGTTQPDKNICTLSGLSFNNAIGSLSVILNYNFYKDSVCLYSGTKYASLGNIDELESLFENEINKLIAKKDAEDSCNNYSSYSPKTTKWTYNYKSSGEAEYRFFTRAEYNAENSTVSLRWTVKGDGNNVQCADNIPLFKEELNVFFPPKGLKYKFYYYDSNRGVIADLPTKVITYETPTKDGKYKKWKFHESVDGIFSGAVLEPNQMKAIENTIHGFISRVKAQNLLNKNCSR